MLTVNPVPTACVAGEPTYPLTLPGSGITPGTMIWTLEKGPGCTMNGSLDPFFDGFARSYAYLFTLPRLMLVSSARYMVRLPFQTPFVSVTWAGEVLPSPKLVISFR